MGVGLNILLNKIEIVFTEQEKIKLIDTTQKIHEPYYLIKLQNIPEQYIGMLATLKEPKNINYWSFC